MALRFVCDYPDCDRDDLTRAEIVQISVQVVDPESGTSQVKKELCTNHGDSVTNELANLGFVVE